MTNDEIAEGLASKKIKDRRRAAKALARNPVESLAGLLYRAFLNEKKGLRTWETQCEMISALGILGHRAALA